MRIMLSVVQNIAELPRWAGGDIAQLLPGRRVLMKRMLAGKDIVASILYGQPGAMI